MALDNVLEGTCDLGDFKKVPIIYSRDNSHSSPIPLVAFPGYQTQGKTSAHLAEACSEHGLKFRSIIPVSNDPERQLAQNIGIDEICEQADYFMQHVQMELHPEKRVILYGNSTGAIPVIHLCSQNPDNIAGLFLVSPLLTGEQIWWSSITEYTIEELKNKYEEDPEGRIRLKHPTPDGKIIEQWLPLKDAVEVAEFDYKKQVYPEGYPDSCTIRCPVELVLAKKDERLHRIPMHFFFQDLPMTREMKTLSVFDDYHHLTCHRDEITGRLMEFAKKVNKNPVNNCARRLA